MSCRFSPSLATWCSAAGTALILAAVAAPCAASEWPQYRGPSANGVTTGGILKTWPAGGPGRVWKTPLNAGFSSFVVAEGQAFTLVLRVIETVKQEVCVALDANTGTELWASPLGFAKYDGGGDSGAPGNSGGDGPRSSPAVAGERVYVMSAGLVLHCLETKTGRIVWKKELVKEFGARNITWQNAASPLLEGDMIFVCAGGLEQSLLCLRQATGDLVWKGQSDKMTHATPVVATILGQRQVIFFTQSGLVSVVPETGQVLWRYAFPYSVSTAASPVVGGDIVFCSAGYSMGAGAVRIAREGAGFTATELWRKPKELMNHWSTSVYHDGHLYGLFGFKQYGQAPLKCVELATGEEKWSRDGFGQGGVVLVDRSLLALQENGELVMVAATPRAYGETARTKALGGKCWNNVAVANGRIYARSTKEGVCLDVSGSVSAR